MFRAREPQQNLFSARNQYLDLLKPTSFHALLAENGEGLFDDYSFEHLYCEDNGRPCIPPSQMFVLLLLQMQDGCSDAEAIERSRFDIRWLAALDIEVGQKLCSKSTLQEFRARVHLNEAAEEQFRNILDVAREMGILKGSSLKVAIDTTPILGRGAVKDTYNLVADGIRKLAGLLAKMDGARPAEWAKTHDLSRYWEASSLKGEAKIDWSDENERRVFLNGLVADAGRLILIAQKRADEAPEDVAKGILEASHLLRRIIVQDTEPVPDPPKGPGAGSTEPPSVDVDNDSGPAEPDVPPEQGLENGRAELAVDAQTADDTEAEVPPQTDDLLSKMVQIRQGVASDRIISVNDPDMRHGRKSASNRFDGYKLSTVADVESGLILGVEVLAGNSADNEGALDLVLQASTNAGLPVEKAVGDCAYGDGVTRKAFEDEGIDLSAKVPAPPANDPFHKSRFVLDLTKKIATCPAGKTTTDVDYARHRGGKVTERFQFPASTCQACPHANDCLRAADKKRNRGRTVVSHPQEELLQKAREYQSTPEFREDVKARQVIEHRQARLVQLGVRQARYTGKTKTRFQALMAAMVANLTLMAKAISLALYSVLQALSGASQAIPGRCPAERDSQENRHGKAA